MVFPILGANTESAEFDVSNSLRFNDGDSPKLQETTGSNSSQKKFTFAAWVKKCQNLGTDQTLFSANDGGHQPHIKFDGTHERLNVRISDSQSYNVQTSRSFRDVAAWYHIVVAMDTTQSTASNRIKIYVNGAQETDLATANYPAEDFNSAINSNTEHTIGRDVTTNNKPFDGYMAEVYFVDGSQLDPTYFGKFNSNGIWIPVELNKGAGGTISFGTHGFYFEFKQTGTSANFSGIGADTSGNDNHLTPSNLSAFDVTTDVPTNNFLTMNPLFINSRGDFREGNTQVQTDVQGSVPYGQVEFGTFAVNKGKWYYEAKATSVGSGGQLALGWNERAEDGAYTNGHNNLGSSGNVWYGSSGKFQDGSTSNTTSPNSYTDDDIIGVAIDIDNKKFYAHKNGTYQSNGTGTGDPANGTNGFTFNTHYNDYWTPWMSKDDTSNEANVKFNFGNPAYTKSSSQADDNGHGNFEYDVPTGFYALNTKNLAEFG